jgi:hypothetical protein
MTTHASTNQNLFLFRQFSTESLLETASGYLLRLKPDLLKIKKLTTSEYVQFRQAGYDLNRDKTSPVDFRREGLVGNLEAVATLVDKHNLTESLTFDKLFAFAKDYLSHPLINSSCLTPAHDYVGQMYSLSKKFAKVEQIVAAKGFDPYLSPQELPILLSRMKSDGLLNEDGQICCQTKQGRIHWKPVLDVLPSWKSLVNSKSEDLVIRDYGNVHENGEYTAERLCKSITAQSALRFAINIAGGLEALKRKVGLFDQTDSEISNWVKFKLSEENLSKEESLYERSLALAAQEFKAGGAVVEDFMEFYGDETITLRELRKGAVSALLTDENLSRFKKVSAAPYDYRLMSHCPVAFTIHDQHNILTHDSRSISQRKIGWWIPTSADQGLGSWGIYDLAFSPKELFGIASFTTVPDKDCPLNVPTTKRASFFKQTKGILNASHGILEEGMSGRRQTGTLESGWGLNGSVPFRTPNKKYTGALSITVPSKLYAAIGEVYGGSIGGLIKEMKTFGEDVIEDSDAAELAVETRSAKYELERWLEDKFETATDSERHYTPPPSAYVDSHLKRAIRKDGIIIVDTRGMGKGKSKATRQFINEGALAEEGNTNTFYNNRSILVSPSRSILSQMCVKGGALIDVHNVTPPATWGASRMLRTMNIRPYVGEGVKPGATPLESFFSPSSKEENDYYEEKNRELKRGMFEAYSGSAWVKVCHGASIGTTLYGESKHLDWQLDTFMGHPDNRTLSGDLEVSASFNLILEEFSTIFSRFKAMMARMQLSSFIFYDDPAGYSSMLSRSVQGLEKSGNVLNEFETATIQMITRLRRILRHPCLDTIIINDADFDGDTLMFLNYVIHQDNGVDTVIDTQLVDRPDFNLGRVLVVVHDDTLPQDTQITKARVDLPFKSNSTMDILTMQQKTITVASSTLSSTHIPDMVVLNLNFHEEWKDTQKEIREEIDLALTGTKKLKVWDDLEKWLFIVHRLNATLWKGGRAIVHVPNAAVAGHLKKALDLATVGTGDRVKSVLLDSKKIRSLNSSGVKINEFVKDYNIVFHTTAITSGVSFEPVDGELGLGIFALAVYVVDSYSLFDTTPTAQRHITTSDLMQMINRDRTAAEVVVLKVNLHKNSPLTALYHAITSSKGNSEILLKAVNLSSRLMQAYLDMENIIGLYGGGRSLTSAGIQEESHERMVEWLRENTSISVPPSVLKKRDAKIDEMALKIMKQRRGVTYAEASKLAVRDYNRTLGKNRTAADFMGGDGYGNSPVSPIKASVEDEVAHLKGMLSTIKDIVKRATDKEGEISFAKMQQEFRTLLVHIKSAFLLSHVLSSNQVIVLEGNPLMLFDAASDLLSALKKALLTSDADPDPNMMLMATGDTKLMVDIGLDQASALALQEALHQQSYFINTLKSKATKNGFTYQAFDEVRTAETIDNLLVTKVEESLRGDVKGSVMKEEEGTNLSFDFRRWFMLGLHELAIQNKLYQNPTTPVQGLRLEDWNTFAYGSELVDEAVGEGQTNDYVAFPSKASSVYDLKPGVVSNLTKKLFEEMRGVYKEGGYDRWRNNPVYWVLRAFTFYEERGSFSAAQTPVTTDTFMFSTFLLMSLIAETVDPDNWFANKVFSIPMGLECDAITITHAFKERGLLRTLTRDDPKQIKAINSLLEEFIVGQMTRSKPTTTSFRVLIKDRAKVRAFLGSMFDSEAADEEYVDKEYDIKPNRVLLIRQSFKNDLEAFTSTRGKIDLDNFSEKEGTLKAEVIVRLEMALGLLAVLTYSPITYGAAAVLTRYRKSKNQTNGNLTLSFDKTPYLQF